MPVSFEKLTAAHDRAAFTCGKPSLDEFIRRYALQNESTGYTRTFVAESPVAAYYSLSASMISFENAPPELTRRAPRYPIPAVRLARLAVDLAQQGRGLGAAALLDAFGRVLTLSEHVGIRLLEIDALDDDARKFYIHNGASAFLDSTYHLFIPVGRLRTIAVR